MQILILTNKLKLKRLTNLQFNQNTKLNRIILIKHPFKKNIVIKHIIYI